MKLQYEYDYGNIKPYSIQGAVSRDNSYDSGIIENTRDQLRELQSMFARLLETLVSQNKITPQEVASIVGIGWEVAP